MRRSSPGRPVVGDSPGRSVPGPGIIPRPNIRVDDQTDARRPATEFSGGRVEGFQPGKVALDSGTGFPAEVNVFVRIVSWGPPDS